MVAGGKDTAGKPRPVVIVQGDRFDATDSITICAFTTDETDPSWFGSSSSRTSVTDFAWPAA